ncbi:MAG: hypothetical protein ACE5LB_18390, partial [Acidiferrobacterales bacterium]
MSALGIKPRGPASRPRGGIARFAPLAPAIRLCAGPSQCAEYTLCQKRFPIRYPSRSEPRPGEPHEFGYYTIRPTDAG